MTAFLNPWVLIGAGVLALALLIGGYAKGRVDSTAHWQSVIVKLEADSQTAKDAEAAKAGAAATTLETDNAKARIIYKTIVRDVDRVVERPVYSNTCLDDLGLQLARAALANASPDSPKPDPALPDALPAR